ncbi:hypothetical protein AB4T57_004599 [Vibrio parahaemolyticus]
MKLHDIIRKEKIEEKFDKKVTFKQFGIDGINEIARIDPNILFEIGAQAWMLYVESGAKVNPQKLASDFDNRNPMIYQKVEKVIKRNVIQDLSFTYAEIDDPKVDSEGCIQLSLCRMYPNDLFIADVVFYDPYKPIAKSERKYDLHYFKSLNLFAVHLEEIKTYCKKNNISRITLTTSSNEQIPYFKAHGFKVEDNGFARAALEHGWSVPMYLPCT